MKIFLVGFMGAGKTTVGVILAEKLKVPFLDLDRLIEGTTEKSVEEIFSEHGERFFRKVESEALVEASRKYSDVVISTGGGIVLKEENRNFIKRNGISVYLKSGIGELWKRISSDTTRPLLKVDKPYSKAEEILNERSELYAQADYTVDTEGLTPDEVASRIADLVLSHERG